MKKVRLFVLAVGMALGVAGLGAADARAEVGATLKVGTLGVGADVTVGLVEQLNARVNLNYFSYSTTVTGDKNDDGSESGSLSPKLTLMTVGGLLDWHPFSQGFRISAGAYLNKNKIDLTADVKGTVDIDDKEYTLSDIGGTVDFKSLAPYVGLGYGNAAGENGNWHFSFDLGVLFSGSPRVSLHATASDPSVQAQLDQSIAEEVKNTEDDMSVFTMYPVLSLGVSYRF